MAFEQLAPITGFPGRHLDAWLMPPAVSREVFARGCLQADLAIVEGTLDEASVAPGQFPFDRPGRLEPLRQALDLPTIALVDAATLRAEHLPRLSPGVEAVIIDGIEDRDTFSSLRGVVQWVWKRPVLGALEALPAARAALRSTPVDRPYPLEVIDQLSASFLRYADLNGIRALADSRAFPITPAEPCFGSGRLFRVAYAQDEAFGGYFPDTLEMLEIMGAELVDFSPLRDECLPEAIDLVMIGCGFPDRHIDALASNLSLITALRAHVCRGRRIYSEGGGTAYLGRTLTLNGRQVEGAGILAVRRRVAVFAQESDARVARSHARRLARRTRNCRPRLSLRPMAVAARPRTRRLPRASWRAHSPARYLFPKSGRWQPDPSPPGRASRSRFRLRRLAATGFFVPRVAQLALRKAVFRGATRSRNAVNSG